MKKSIKVASKKRGRPPSGGRDPGVHIRLPEEMLKAIDAFSRADDINRSEAIRRLVEIGLAVRTKSKQPTAEHAVHAKALAWKTLESLTPGAADDDEKTSRKRRLIKGPEEFQGVRIDQPPASSGKKPTRSG